VIALAAFQASNWRSSFRPTDNAGPVKVAVAYIRELCCLIAISLRIFMEIQTVSGRA